MSKFRSAKAAIAKKCLKREVGDRAKCTEALSVSSNLKCSREYVPTTLRGYLDDGTVDVHVYDSQSICGGDRELRAARAPPQAIHLDRQLLRHVLPNLAMCTC